MIIDTGYLAMMDATCSMDVVAIKGAKNMIFGGEGIFNTVVTGPGKDRAPDYADQYSGNSDTPFGPTKDDRCSDLDDGDVTCGMLRDLMKAEGTVQASSSDGSGRLLLTGQIRIYRRNV